MPDLAARQAVSIRKRGYRASSSGVRVVMPASDYAALWDAVITDPFCGPVERGWLLGGNGNLVTTPDWAWHPMTVALLRLYVVALYLPIIRPALRFFAHAAPEPQAPRQRTIMPGCGVRWRSPMHDVVECQEHRDGEHWWHGNGEHYAWVDDFWLLAYMVPGSEET